MRPDDFEEGWVNTDPAGHWPGRIVLFVYATLAAGMVVGALTALIRWFS